MGLPDWVEDNKKELSIGVIGLGLMGFGLWKSYAKQVAEDSKVTIENLQTVTNINNKIIVVDVSGAVIKPGIYTLKEGARINDALVSAGGLAVEADRGYVGRYMNLAEKLSDGMKVHIPIKDDPSIKQGDREHPPAGEAGVLGDSKTEVQKTISINTASMSELDSLWGIGEARARQIIEARPYQTVDELVTKALIPTNVLEKNKSILSI